MNPIRICIGITAFNRPNSLSRLLKSISRARYPENYFVLDLVISIDFSGNKECSEIADLFIWNFGKKRVVKHQRNIGLKENVIYCGDLCLDYDAVIIFEDDVIVGPNYYHFALDAYYNYRHEESIAGIALFSQHYNELAYCPFQPIDDGYDVYFMKVPASWGQIFWKSKWQAFKQYLSNPQIDFEMSRLPEAVKHWKSETSWKKYFYQFIVDNNYYFVYPRVGHATNAGDIGTHYNEVTKVWLNPMHIGTSTKFKFSDFSQSIALYDAYMEWDTAGYNRFMKNNDSIEFDINGSKNLLHVCTEYLVSSKYCKNPDRIYDMLLYPFELNIALDMGSSYGNGHVISYSRTSDFNDEIRQTRFDLDLQRMLGISKNQLQIKSKYIGLHSIFSKVKQFILGRVNEINK